MTIIVAMAETFNWQTAQDGTLYALVTGGPDRIGYFVVSGKGSFYYHNLIDGSSGPVTELESSEAAQAEAERIAGIIDLTPVASEIVYYNASFEEGKVMIETTVQGLKTIADNMIFP